MTSTLTDPPEEVAPAEAPHRPRTFVIGMTIATALAAVVRVLWVLAFLCGGTGLLLYVILWIVLPVEPLYVPVATQTSTTS